MDRSFSGAIGADDCLVFVIRSPYASIPISLLRCRAGLRLHCKLKPGGNKPQMAYTTGKSIATLFGILALTGLPAVHAQAQRQLVMYCGVDEKWCRAVATAYQKETGVQVDMTRMSAGEVYARVRAEKDNPHGDMWFGGTGDPHLQAADEKITEPYKSPMLPKLRDWAQSQAQRSQQPHRRAVPRRTRLRLQHRGHQEEEDDAASLLGRPDQARIQGRGADGRSQLLRHRLDDAGDHRATHGRGQRLRVSQGAAPEHQRVHQGRCGAGAGRRAGRDAGRHRLPARRDRCRRSRTSRSRWCRRAKAPATRSAR